MEEQKTIKKETTHLVVSMEFRDWLDNKGKRNESFEGILKRLVDYNK